MPSFNKTILVGNLTRDPETRNTGGSYLAEFGLAVNEKRKDKEQVTFVDVTVWNKTAELVAKYLTKGSQCLVEGRLRYETWEDKDSGKKRSKLAVTGDRVVFLGGKSKEREDRTRQGLDDVPPHSSEGDEEDSLPF